MYPNSMDPAAAYRKVGLETQLDSASPHKLILMLFEGAQIAASNAKHHMNEGNLAEKGKAISKCIEIISAGLQASLDHDSGGDLATRLDALYEYMGRRLLYANLKNDTSALTEVTALLAELKGAWEQIEVSAAGKDQEVRNR